MKESAKKEGARHMKNKAKAVYLLMAVLLALGVLAGCSGGGGSGGKVTITYWRHDNEAEVKALNQLIASFEKEHPNIKVKMEVIPYDDYETKIRTALSGSKAPDIMGIDGPFVASYAHQEAVIPLDSYFAANGDLDDITAPVRESLTYNGKIWAAPLNDASVAMFYNKKLFADNNIPLPSENPDEAWTWEQVLEAAKKINNPEKIFTAGIRHGESAAEKARLLSK